MAEQEIISAGPAQGSKASPIDQFTEQGPPESSASSSPDKTDSPLKNMSGFTKK